MLNKSTKKTINCLLATAMVLSLSCVQASAKSLDSNQTALTATATEQGETNLEDYSSFKITNGVGAVGKAGISLTKGATADINVNVKVTCITQDDLVEFIQNNKSSFTAEQYSQITQSAAYQNGYSAATLLNGILALKFDNSSTNVWGTYTNVNGKQVTTGENENKQLLKSLHDMTQHSYELNGKLTAVGQSYIPTTAYCFVEVSRIQFQDGNILKVVNTKATIGDSNGSTSKVSDSSDNGPLILTEL